jgi:hypothetical protein
VLQGLQETQTQNKDGKMQITLKLDESQMQELQNLTDAIRLLQKTLVDNPVSENSPEPKKTKKKPAETKAEAVSENSPKEDTETTPAVTYDDIKLAGPKFIMANSKDAFLELLKKYRAETSPKELKEEDYEAFYKEITDGAQ